MKILGEFIDVLPLKKTLYELFLNPKRLLYEFAQDFS